MHSLKISHDFQLLAAKTGRRFNSRITSRIQQVMNLKTCLVAIRFSGIFTEFITGDENEH